jgi:hypothetical protein
MGVAYNITSCFISMTNMGVANIVIDKHGLEENRTTFTP